MIDLKLWNKLGIFPRSNYFIARNSLMWHIILSELTRIGIIHMNQTTKSDKNNSNKKKFRKGKILIVGNYTSPHFLGLISNFPEKVFKEIRTFNLSDKPSQAASRNPRKILNTILRLLLKTCPKKCKPAFKAYLLARLILKYKPEVVHLHEIEISSQILAKVVLYPKLSKTLNTVVFSSWGSDLRLGARFGRNSKQIDVCLSKADYVTVETQSEVLILQSTNFSGSIYSGLLNSGGVGPVNRKTAQCSTRKGILVKGVQDLPGRALNALAVLPRIRSTLLELNHKVYVYSASPEVVIMCELLKKDLGIDIEVVSQVGDLLEKSIFLKYFEECRVYLGCSISNGASTSMLEAMSRGAFPIESQNSLAEEVIKQSENGFIIDPWEQEVLAASLVEALSNDRMVDSAQEMNLRIIRENYSVIQQKMLWTDFYRNVLVN
jgi:hypothetical protein